MARGDGHGNGRRIAMVSTHGYVAARPPLGAADTGGQVVYVLELSKKLAELGYEVDIWTRLFEGQSEIEPVETTVRIIRVPCGGPAFVAKEVLFEHIEEWAAGALSLMSKLGLHYDLVNSHYWDAGIGGQIVADTLGITHVHTPHSLGAWKQRQMRLDSPGGLEKKYNFTTRIARERAIYAAASMVVATTPDQADMLAADYGVKPERCTLIPPGYDDRRFFPVSSATRQAIRQRLGFQGTVFLAVGRIASNKGYDLLLSAMRLVARRVPDATLHLAIGGATLDEKDAQALESLAQQLQSLGLLGRVHFGGFVPEEDLADHYRAADAFVLSSRYEPFGMTAIEAMACGTPTIVTIHGGLWRSLSFGRHALFADPLDAEDLAIMMSKPFQLPKLRARMIRMGAHKARSLFSWTGIAHQLLGAIGYESTATLGVESGETEWEEPWNDGD